jgi:cytochrome c-type biogenesis protein CcmH
VVRTSTGQWPLKFLLDDSQAMFPTRTLSKVGRVTVEARISHSGMANAESGDFQSAVTMVDPSQHKSVRLVIDRVIG